MAHIDMGRHYAGETLTLIGQQNFGFQIFPFFDILEKKIKQVGQCISGQSLRRAVTNISRVIGTFHHNSALINLGSVDLLQGRELVDMVQDIYRLCRLLCDNHIFPIVTTIPPLANQLHNPNLENKRKQFNNFLKEKFDCIDIEDVFYTNYCRVMFNQYQR